MIASGWSNARSRPQVRFPATQVHTGRRASLIFQAGDLKTRLLSSRDVPRLWPVRAGLLAACTARGLDDDPEPETVAEGSRLKSP